MWSCWQDWGRFQHKNVVPRYKQDPCKIWTILWDDCISSIGYTKRPPCATRQHASVIIDFRISQRLTVDINSVFGWLYCVDVGNAEGILQVNAASIFIYPLQPWRWRQHVPSKHHQQCPTSTWCDHPITEIMSTASDVVQRHYCIPDR
jgi:hypothetical protein